MNDVASIINKLDVLSLAVLSWVVCGLDEVLDGIAVPVGIAGRGVGFGVEVTPFGVSIGAVVGIGVT
jgi:hypothetical protein